VRAAFRAPGGSLDGGLEAMRFLQARGLSKRPPLAP